MFSDRLKTTLSLAIGSETHALAAGSIESFRLDVRPWGFDAQVGFYVSSEQEEDAVFPGFTGSALTSVVFTLARDVEGEDDGSTLKLTGWIVERSVSEVVGEGVKGAPVVARHYRLRFVDPAQAFWSLHRPLELYSQSSMKDVIELHKPAGVDLTYDMGALDTKQPVFCLPLHGDAEPSFYDFLVWWIDRHRGVLELDARGAKYRIGAKKARGAAAKALDPEEVASTRILLPEPPRFAGRILNPFSLAPTTKDLANALAATGVRRDVLVHTPIAALVDERAQLETDRFRPRPPGFVVTYKRCPEVMPQPGDLFSVGEPWSDQLFASGRTLRTVGLRASAERNAAATAEPEEAAAVYDVELAIELEDRSSAVAWLPPFRDPRRVLRVEGAIVSKRGGDADRSWSPVENENDSLWTYDVDVPLFNKKVPVPFAPTWLSGHFFFPAYKKQRVLVDLEWDRARLAGFLDWADEARLPTDSQGDQIVLGFQSSNGTIIRHAYEDTKPTLKIERNTDEETQLISIVDGGLTISLAGKQTVPTAVPTFDLSPQVEAAKDQVTSEVGGSIAQVTSQFQASTGQLSGGIDDTTANVDQEVGKAERELRGQVDQASAELQGMAADASAATVAVTAAVTASKAELGSVLQDVAAMREPIVAAERTCTAFLAKTSAQVASLEGSIAAVGKGAETAFDEPAVAAERVRALVQSRAATLREQVRALETAPSEPLAKARADAQLVGSEIASVGSSLDADLAAGLAAVGAAFAPVEQAIAERRAATPRAVDAALAELDAKRTHAAAAVARRADARALGVRLDAAVAEARATAAQLRAELEGSLGAIEADLAVQRAAAESAARGAHQRARAALASLESTAGGLAGSVDAAESRVAASAKSAATAANAQIGALERGTLAALDPVAASAKQGKAAFAGSVSTARTSLAASVAPVRTLVGTAESAVKTPLAAARAAVDAAEQSAKAAVTAAQASLDATLGTALATLSGLIATFQSALKGAIASLDAVRALVTGLRAQIMPPIELLSELVTQIETVFQSGVSLLSGFVDKAGAALDAIPAAALPKALVQPTTQAIQAALSAVLPLIATASQQAGTQLGTLAGTLLGQVKTAETAALSGVTTFSGTVTGQIAAIVPPVKQQLQTILQQIDTASTGVIAQVRSATSTAVQTVRATLATAASQARAAATAASTQLEQLDRQLSTATATARASIDAQNQALTAQARAAAAAIRAPVDQAATSLDAGAKSVEASIAAARQRAAAEVQAQATELSKTAAATRAQVAGLRPTLATGIAAARTSADTAATALAARVPTASAVDGRVTTTFAPFASRIDAIAP